jgi:amidohydrolase
VQPGGAIDMVADGAIEGVERIFALHCDPRLEVGQLGTRVGPITSACDVLEVRLTSPGGHTSRPHLTADLVEAIGLLITQVPLLLTRHVDPRSGTVLVWGAVQAGEAANAIPQHGVLRGTLRTADHATWGELEDTIQRLVESVLAPTGVTYELEHIRGVPPVVNEATSTGMLTGAAITVGGPEAAAETLQSSGGEDFAWYLEHVPGAMARLGVWSGHGPMRDIHQPTFDLDERALPFGVRVLTQAALTALTT